MSHTAPSSRPRPVSAAKIEANRRNAQKSTGPRTPEGKAASRMNAVTHGFRCEVVEPEAQRERIESRAEAWAYDFDPDDTMQAWHVHRAAAVSVRLDLCVEAEIDARKAGAKRAGQRFETSERAKIRQLAGQIEHDPIGVVTALEASGYGLDWLIAELRGMASDLDDSDGYLGEVERRRALAMLKINPRNPSVNHEHPVAGPFMRAALGNDSDHSPAEADRWTGLHVRDLPEVARRAEHAKHLPSMEEGRLHCLAVILARLEELESVRDAVYAEMDAPRIAEARRRGGAIGGTKKAHTLRRYESALSLDMTRAMSSLLRLRRESDRRPVRDEPATAFDLIDDAPELSPTEPFPAPECQSIDTPAPAPNEPKLDPGDPPKSLENKNFRETPPEASTAHEPGPAPLPTAPGATTPAIEPVAASNFDPSPSSRSESPMPIDISNPPEPPIVG